MEFRRVLFRSDCSPGAARHARNRSNTCLASGACRPTLGDVTTEPRGSDIRSQEACPMTPSTQRSPDLPHGGEDALAEIAPVTESLTRRQRPVLETKIGRAHV